MRDVAIVGAGKIGSMIADGLLYSGDYRVTVIDKSAEQLSRLRTNGAAERLAIDVEAPAELARALEGKFAVLSAAPFHLTGQDRRSRRRRRRALPRPDRGRRHHAAGQGARRDERPRPSFPQCGLAPGFISIVAYDLAKRFDTLHDVRMRVGALPQYPSNALNYNLTWSTDGVINEYCEPCEAIVDGVLREVPALEEREEFSLDGVTYEAFNTSGGLGTCARRCRQGAQPQLPHHPLSRPRRDHEGAAQRSAPARSPRRAEGHPRERPPGDAAGRGHRLRHRQRHARTAGFVQETYANKIYGQTSTARMRSAIQITTAAGICARAGHAGRRQAARSAASSGRKTSRWRISCQPLRAGLCRRNEPRTGEMSTLMKHRDILEGVGLHGPRPGERRARGQTPIDGTVLGTRRRSTTRRRSKPKCEAAHDAFLAWRAVPAPRRGELVRVARRRAARRQGRPRAAGHAGGGQDRSARGSAKCRR